ncbi:MAG: hypothetical protein SA339_06165 [Methanomassiliicoccus sp.]|nr:hypothetical protein [Methanomassiliicoccus sp.]
MNISEIVYSPTAAGLKFRWLHETRLRYFKGYPLRRKQEDGHWELPDGNGDISLTFFLLAERPG